MESGAHRKYELTFLPKYSTRNKTLHSTTPTAFGFFPIMPASPSLMAEQDHGISIDKRLSK